MLGVDTTVLIHLEIKESPEHARSHEWLRREVLNGGEVLAVVPQILAEFVHVVTDPNRFQSPLSMENAIEKARFWWNAAEVRRIYPTAESTTIFLDWMHTHRLGRKRLLDTQLAAAFHSAGVRKVVTSNLRDFSIFGCFEVLTY